MKLEEFKKELEEQKKNGPLLKIASKITAEDLEEYLPIYNEYMEPLSILGESEAGRLFKAMFEYRTEEEETVRLSRLGSSYFELIKLVIDKDLAIAGYETAIEKYRERTTELKKQMKDLKEQIKELKQQGGADDEGR